MKKFFVLALALVMIAGCAGVGPKPLGPYTITTPYSDADFAPGDAPGPGQLDGQAFLKTVGGDVRTCAGNDVFLMPATAYVKDMLARQSSSQSYANVDTRVNKHFRSVRCDAQGHFHFDNLAARDWEVDTLVTWGVPNVYSGGIDQQGGELVQLVSMKPGANSTILNDSDLHR